MNTIKKEDKNIGDNLKISSEAVSKPIDKILSKIDVEWKTVLTLRYGLNGNPPMSVKEVSEYLGTTPEAISSLEANALRCLYTRKDK